jgi:hypothetical protein
MQNGLMEKIPDRAFFFDIFCNKHFFVLICILISMIDNRLAQTVEDKMNPYSRQIHRFIMVLLLSAVIDQL